MRYKPPLDIPSGQRDRGRDAHSRAAHARRVMPTPSGIRGERSLWRRASSQPRYRRATVPDALGRLLHPSSYTGARGAESDALALGGKAATAISRPCVDEVASLRVWAS